MAKALAVRIDDVPSGIGQFERFIAPVLNDALQVPSCPEVSLVVEGPLDGIAPFGGPPFALSAIPRVGDCHTTGLEVRCNRFEQVALLLIPAACFVLLQALHPV